MQSSGAFHLVQWEFLKVAPPLLKMLYYTVVSSRNLILYEHSILIITISPTRPQILCDLLISSLVLMKSC